MYLCHIVYIFFSKRVGVFNDTLIVFIQAFLYILYLFLTVPGSVLYNILYYIVIIKNIL